MDTVTAATVREARPGPAEGQSPADLVGAARRGSERAWAELVLSHQHLLRAVARGFRLSDEEAADAVQNTWLALLTGVERLRDPERVAGWLASTMRRECLKALRKRQQERLVASGVPEVRDRCDDLDGVDRDLMLAERKEMIWRAVDRLAPRQRQLLRALAATPQPSYAEIADQLQMAVGTIGPTRLRALRRLREVLAAELDSGALDLAA